ncbi:MAG: GAF domain-containing protein [Deltaproteobacteria bacterium]|nr:GAF domain-containing protein [Deltaproteobacteria bacterium]
MARSKPSKRSARRRGSVASRATAEQKLGSAAPRGPPGKTAEKLLHELGAHQLELEMQNEELKRAQLVAEEARDRYAELYDFAPVGYLTLSREGRVVEANLAASALLGIERSRLIGRGLGHFVAPADLERWEQHLLRGWRSSDKQACELALNREDGATLWVRLESVRAEPPATTGGADARTPVLRVALSDISERKRAEEELRQSARALNTAQRIAHLGSWAWYIKTNRLAWSDEMYRIFGIPVGELPDGPSAVLLRAVHPDDRAEVERANLAVVRGGKPTALKYRVVWPDQTVRVVWAEPGELTLDADGNPDVLTGIALDITERERTATLLQSRVRLSEAAQHMSMQALMQTAVDEAERLTDSRAGFFHLVSDDQENVRLQAWSTRTVEHMCKAEGQGEHYPISAAGVWVDCFHARAPVIHNDYAGLKHKKGLPEGHAPIVRQLTVPILRRGAVVAILGVGNKLTDYTDGDIAVLQALAEPVMDLAAIRRAEDAERQAHARMKDIVRLAPAFISVMRGREHVFEMCNEKYLEVVGRRDIIGLPIRQALPELEGQGFFELLDDVFATGVPYVAKETTARLRRTPEGQLQDVHVDFVYLPLREADGSISGVFVHGVDLTEQVLARRRIEHVAEQAQGTAEGLEQRVAERTAALSQTVEALQKEVARRTVAEKALRDRSEQLRALAAELTMAEQRERQRLAQLLHDGLQQLLVGARFQLGVLEQAEDPAARRVAVKVNDLLADAIGTARSLTADLSPPILLAGGLVAALKWLAQWMRQKQGLNVSVETRGRVEPVVDAVNALLFQATRELLFNVVKHAGVRSAQVQVTWFPDRVQVTVTDKGGGCDPARLRVGGGSAEGFGLFSIRERLDLLGGRMEIDSGLGRGSRFTLVAPLTASALKAPPSVRKPEAEASLRLRSQGGADGQIRVVLVDDHIVMRQGLATLLQNQPDIRVVGEAPDAETAMKVVRQLRPDVVLMDVSLPGMDGIEATRLIHAEMSGVRVIGLSMFEEVERRDAMRAAGAVDYITKSGPSIAVVAAIRACVRSGGIETSR